MVVILLESALRSIMLALAVWLILSLARIRNPRMHRLAWLIVLFATVAMPLLMQVSMLSIGPAPAAFWSGAIEWIRFAFPGKAPPFAWSEVLLEIYLLVTAVFVLRYIYALGRLLWLRRKAIPIDVEATHVDAICVEANQWQRRAGFPGVRFSGNARFDDPRAGGVLAMGHAHATGSHRP